MRKRRNRKLGARARRRIWIRESVGRQRREQLQAELRGWRKLLHPWKAWRLYRTLRAVSESKRRAANDRILEARLADPALADLNEEQRRAVIVQEDRTLVVAGAGTGKTHTMVAKARDTVRTRIARASDIAFVTFTRKAAQEIRERSADLEGMEIGTLHHLARLVIAHAEGRKPRLTPLAKDDNERLDRFESWLLEAIQEDPGLLADLETRTQAFARCRAPGGEAPPQEVRVPPNGVLVRSIGEARIATTLHLAGIDYRYEAEFPVPEEHQSRKGARYHPDFYLPDEPDAAVAIHGGVWLEHFAHDADGELPKRWDEEKPGATEKYRRDREWKEGLHDALGTRFAWTEYGDIQRCQKARGSFPDLLLRRIAEQGKSGFMPPSRWNVESHIAHMKAEQGADGRLRVTYEIDAWIRTVRQQVNTEQALRAALSTRETAEEVGALYRLAQPVLERYERHLQTSGCVDHEGTILKAWSYLRDGVVAPPWRVILVDEYQDVNPAQSAFVHALLAPRDPERPSTGARLTAVGDDWQAIFGFQGGDVDLIRRFDDPAGACTSAMERIAVTQTYRFGQPLADSTHRFVVRGKGAIDREVVGAPQVQPHPRWPSSIVVASSKLTPEGERRVGARHRGLTGAVLAAPDPHRRAVRGCRGAHRGPTQRRPRARRGPALRSARHRPANHRHRGGAHRRANYLLDGPQGQGHRSRLRHLPRHRPAARGRGRRGTCTRARAVALQRVRHRARGRAPDLVRRAHESAAQGLPHRVDRSSKPQRVRRRALPQRGRAIRRRRGRARRVARAHAPISALPHLLAQGARHSDARRSRRERRAIRRMHELQRRARLPLRAHRAGLRAMRRRTDDSTGQRPGAVPERALAPTRHRFAAAPCRDRWSCGASARSGERFWGCQRFGLQDSCAATKPLP